jgi:hypothetical protein
VEAKATNNSQKDAWFDAYKADVNRGIHFYEMKEHPKAEVQLEQALKSFEEKNAALIQEAEKGGITDV